MAEKTLYYLLTDADLAAGATIAQDDDELTGTDYITTNPELIAFYEITGDLGLVELFGTDAKHPLRLALLEPLGDVEAEPAGSPFRRSEQGWKVTEVQLIDAVFGPAAPQIRATIDRAESILTWDENKAISDRFMKATNATWDEIEPAERAAQAALDAAGMYGWANIGGCVYGYVYVALAGRHLIGTTPEWTAEAYTVLTGPWAAAFGTPIHPDDTVSEASK